MGAEGVFRAGGGYEGSCGDYANRYKRSNIKGIVGVII